MWWQQRGLLSWGPSYWLVFVSCPLKRKLLTVTSACNLVHVINQPTRVLQTLHEQDLHVLITFLLILYSLVLKLYLCPLAAVTTIQWLYPEKPKFKMLGLKYCIRGHIQDFVVTLMWMMINIFVGLIWLIRSIQTPHLRYLWNCSNF